MIGQIVSVSIGLFILGFILWLIVGTYFQNKQMYKYKEKMKEDMKDLMKKHEVPVDDYIETKSFTGHPLISNQNYKKRFYNLNNETLEYKSTFLIWINRNCFNILRTNIFYDEVAPVVKIPLYDIKSYEFVGNITERMYISGGGGGGSSLKGAIIGGAVAGVPGAIIGSRKKGDPIKTTYKTEDSRYLEINFNYEKMNKTVIQRSEVYGYLYKHMPEKAN